MKRNAFIMLGVTSVIMVSGLGVLTSYATSSGTVNNQETQAKPAVYAANLVQSMGDWENTNNIWKFKLKSGEFLKYSWIQSASNDNFYYYLDYDGVMLTNTITPDGYMVDADGIWTSNKAEQTQAPVESVPVETAPQHMDKSELDAVQEVHREEAESIENNEELKRLMEERAKALYGN